MKEQVTRLNEWYVPQFGPIKFRIFVGMMFLPYTGMCISFSIIGSLLAPTLIAWDRIIAIIIIYFTALGISAHAADSMGSKKNKPWGDHFSNLELQIMLVSGLVIAYAIGTYYMIFFVPLLLPIAILEGFFLFAYNYELWNGFFHNNVWFAISWGSMPLLAGYVMQTNSLTLVPLLLSFVAFLISYLEINLSRKYKKFKQSNDMSRSKKLEFRLKIISMSTILFSVTFLIFRTLRITF
jgi:heme O synthase-like polyprenyltransferase